MWELLFIAAAILLVTPPLRPVLAWTLGALFGPLIGLTRVRYRPSPAAVPTDEATLPPDARAALTSADADLLPAGFTPVGVWTIERGDGLTTSQLRILARPVSGTTCAVTRHILMGVARKRVLEFTTYAQHGTVRTLGEALSLPPLQGERIIDLPTLTRPGWLLTAHEALVREADLGPPHALPSDVPAWTAQIDETRERILETERRRGRVTRPNRRGVRRLTLVGCLVSTAAALWPWKGRARARALARERETLARLGLTDLLEEARRSPDADAAEKAAAAPAGAVTLADDRATPRRIARGPAARQDERWADARFRAAVEQSEAARMAQYRRNGLVFGIGMIALMVVGVLMRVPPAALIIGAFLITMGVNVFLNFGRAGAGERAAADALLRRGLCASCLYGLGGLTPEPDGCLVCPECGGAWRAERVREVIAFDPDARALAGAELTGAASRAAAALSTGTLRQRSPFRDARRQKCLLVPPRLEHETALAADPALRDRLCAAAKDIARSGRLLRWGTAGFLALVGVVLPLGVILLSTVRKGVMPGLAILPLLIPVASFGLLAWGVLRGNFGYRRKRIVRAMLARALCPACAEDLTGRPIAADGLVECTCGTAWSALAPAHVPAPFPAPPTHPPTAPGGVSGAPARPPTLPLNRVDTTST
jgi:hypothetical protein